MPSPSQEKYNGQSSTLPPLVPGLSKEEPNPLDRTKSIGLTSDDKSVVKKSSLSNLIKLRGLARAGRLSIGSNALEPGKAARSKIKTRESSQDNFHPNYDDAEKPSVRFIYSEAVKKALKRIGLSLSRSRLRDSSDKHGDLDTTDSSLEINFLDEIRTSVAERMAFRQLHPSRSSQRGQVNRSQAGSRQATARLSALQKRFHPITQAFGVMTNRRRIGDVRLPPLAISVAEEGEEEEEGEIEGNEVEGLREMDRATAWCISKKLDSRLRKPQET